MYRYFVRWVNIYRIPRRNILFRISKPMIATKEQVTEDRALVDAAMKRLWTAWSQTNQDEFQLK